jgi:hypothetical protein
MGILQDAFEVEETEQSKRNRDFKALEKCEKNGGVGMLLRCLWVIENVTFLSELNQVSFLYRLLPSHGSGCWDFSRCNFVWFVCVGNMSWCSCSLDC